MTGLFVALAVGLLLTVVLPVLSFLRASEVRVRTRRLEERLQRIERRLATLTSQGNAERAAPAEPAPRVSR